MLGCFCQFRIYVILSKQDLIFNQYTWFQEMEYPRSSFIAKVAQVSCMPLSETCAFNASVATLPSNWRSKGEIKRSKTRQSSDSNPAALHQTLGSLKSLSGPGTANPTSRPMAAMSLWLVPLLVLSDSSQYYIDTTITINPAFDTQCEALVSPHK